MNISILGATGSIGMQTLDVIRTTLNDAKVTALSGNSNIERLSALANEFKPRLICVPDGDAALLLKERLRYPCDIVTGKDGKDGLLTCASQSEADVIVNALVGRAGLQPTLAAIDAGKNIALANKETLVTAGALVMDKAKEKGVRVTPIDSEHSAILQCLAGNEGNAVEKIILTASGGPFRKLSRDRIKSAAASDALRHPNWKMGRKITIDSATLMNKGLEVIEAMRLYDMPLEKIDVLVHPQSVVHSMVEFADGAVMAQLGVPDMRVPISYALTAPKRAANYYPKLNLLTQDTLTFEQPDTERFPCLKLAYIAAEKGGTLPAVMNYINEAAVNYYLQNKISFYGISDIIADAFASYTVRQVETVSDIEAAEAWAEDFFLTNI
jgi:1-deoxy-D-xylulose-5-phosphate reductoisomerase